MDSIKPMKNTDTLNAYKAPIGGVSGCGAGSSTGYMVGTNCYKDKEVAQYFAPSSYTAISKPQIHSVIVLFDSAGTKASNPATQVVCKIYGGSVGSGPAGVIGSKSDSLGKIIAGAKESAVGYLGKPGVSPISNTKIYPFRFDFASPIVVSSPSSGFFAGIQLPNSQLADSVSIFSSTKANTSLDSNAWYLSAINSWRTYRTNRNSKIQLAIIPIITCGPVGINEESFNRFNSNINVMPNPSSDLFNFVFTLPEQQSLTFRIFNTMGQEIIKEDLKQIMNNVIQINMGDKPDGIYFAEISNGTEKALKKIVVQH
jgi:hypothetical protein